MNPAAKRLIRHSRNQESKNANHTMRGTMKEKSGLLEWNGRNNASPVIRRRSVERKPGPDQAVWKTLPRLSVVTAVAAALSGGAHGYHPGLELLIVKVKSKISHDGQ
jgi:hypothetical protein